MHLSWIKYRRLATGETCILRLPSAASGAAVYFGPPAALAELSLALRYALSGHATPDLLGVALQFADARGDHWTVERHSDAPPRIFANQKDLGAAGANRLAEAWWDYELSLGAAMAAQPIDLYELVVDGADFCAREYTATSKHAGPEAVITERRLTLAKSTGAYLGSPEALSASQALQFVQRLEPLWQEGRELATLQEWQQQRSAKLPRWEPSAITKIEQELGLIQKIKELADPLLDPALAPTAIRAKVQSTSAALNAALSSLGLSAIPGPDTPWDQVVATLARLNAYQRLVQAAEQAKQLSESELRPLYSEYATTLAQVVAQDESIANELNEALLAVSQEVHRISSEGERLAAEKEQRGRGLWRRPIFGRTEPEVDATMFGPAEVAAADSGLSLIRLAVQQAQDKLADLKVDTQSAAQRCAANDAAVVAFHGKLERELQRLQAVWRELALKLGLPQDLKLKQLLRLISAHGQIHSLNEELNSLQRQQLEQRAHLQQLEQLVTDWRHLTGSQKDTPLTPVSILLAEARGICQYYDKKRAVLARSRDQEGRAAAWLDLRDELAQRLGAWQEAWQKVFFEMGYPLVTFKGRDWSSFFDSCRELIIYGQLLHGEKIVWRGNDVFALAARPSPLSAYILRDATLRDTNREHIVTRLLAAPPAGLALILCSDAKLLAALTSKGIPRLEEVLQRPKETVVNSAPEVRPTLLSTRAKVAMEILNSKAGR